MGQITRRRALAGLGGLGLGAGFIGRSSAADPLVVEPFPDNATDALRRLKEGNERFVLGQTLHAHESADWRKQLIGGQKPFATILGCSDSRVPVELVFDQGFGDLFTVRVAGNVVAPDIVGSIEYAVAHLQTQLIVVMGHQSCGAVTAAVEAMQRDERELAGIETLIKLIEPGLPHPLPGDTQAERIAAAVEANVRWSMKELAKLPEAERALDVGTTELHGAVYDLNTGTVRFLT